MNRGLGLVLAVVLTLAIVTPGLAATIVITAVAPLESQSDEAVQAALDSAVGRAVDDAIERGLRPIQLASAEVWSDRVVVQVVATTDELGDEASDAQPGSGEPDLG